MTWVLKDGGHYLSFVSTTGMEDEFSPVQNDAHRFASRDAAKAVLNDWGRRHAGLTLVRLKTSSRL